MTYRKTRNPGYVNGPAIFVACIACITVATVAVTIFAALA
jgi:hypothetical protein